MFLLSTFVTFLTISPVISWAKPTPQGYGRPPLPPPLPGQPGQSGQSAPLAFTRNGTYQGIHDSNYNQDYFLGMPFAQPPVGPNGRLHNPRPLNTSFQGVKSAQQFGPGCVGYGGGNVGPFSEDCLTINVFRPSGYMGQPLPVGIWVYGGGFLFGSGSAPQYNMSNILRNSVQIGKPIITVTFNYRLSGWGWLYGDDVQADGSTNLGLRDQRLAFAWVQENIGGFGGDPTKVTIWGESAGAASVSAHALAYNGRDDHLFRAIIPESGPPLQPNYYPLPVANGVYNNITQNTGCGSAANKLDCLRNLPFATLNNELNRTTYQFYPAIDNDILQQLGSVQLKNGQFTKTPMLVGTVSDEGTLFEPLGINTDQDFINYMGNLGVTNTADINAFLQAYPDDPSQGTPATLPGRPNSTIGLQYKRETTWTTDYFFLAGRRFSCQAWTNYSVPAYAWRFNILSNGYTPEMGVAHYTEVAFVYDNTAGLGVTPNPFDNEPASHKAAADLISKTWVSFIHDLDPNNHGVQGTPHWPVYNNANPQDFVFDANVTALAYVESDTFRAQGVNLFNSLAQSVFHR